mmetsp:Transcript_66232/g.188073  ORF Transcript_66232/g.188073 Transcript_66232/m.188073 type:complete len:234 (+) Transcript_66232:498-1199(+)
MRGLSRRRRSTTRCAASSCRCSSSASWTRPRRPGTGTALRGTSPQLPRRSPRAGLRPSPRCCSRTAAACCRCPAARSWPSSALPEATPSSMAAAQAVWSRPPWSAPSRASRLRPDPGPRSSTRTARTSQLPPSSRPAATTPSSLLRRSRARAATGPPFRWTTAATHETRTSWWLPWPRPTRRLLLWRLFRELWSCHGRQLCLPFLPTSCRGRRQAMPLPTCCSARSIPLPSSH